MELELAQWALLLGGAAVAGWVDAVIGGGGLVLIPLIMAVIPGVAPATALATNKLAAVSGTASAAFTLMRTVQPPMKETLKLGLIAGIASGVGALAATLMQEEFMRPLIIVLLLAVGTFVAFKPSFGTGNSDGVRGGWRTWAALAAVAGIGFMMASLVPAPECSSS